jgi:ATP-binding cassette subfamily B protein
MPIRTIISIFEQIQSGMTGFARFMEVLNYKKEEDNLDAIDLDDIKEEISFNDVSFSYVNNESDCYDSLVLSHLTFKINKGTTVALVGPSGGGKTTICHLLPRFYEINSGQIEIDHIDIKKYSRFSLRKNIGIVQQDVYLFAGTIRENIAYGKIDASEDEIIDAAIKANIWEYIQELPDGLDTYVGERGVKLSGGQKQRISIARAFLKNPPILILDEATSALDNVTEMQIQKALENLSIGRTTLVVAHRLSTVKNADNIIVIDKNGIIEQGNHNELIKKNGVYANLYQYQFKD